MTEKIWAVQKSWCIKWSIMMEAKQKQTKTNNLKRSKPGRKRNEQHEVKTKCEAVLSIWSERRKPAEVCRELGINWAVLSQWQNKALEGMIESLDPKGAKQKEKMGLNPMLEDRLKRQMVGREAKLSRLEQRFTEILKDRQSKTTESKSAPKGGTPVSEAKEITP